MTDDEHDMIRELRDFFFKPLGPKRETRAYEIDQLLESVRTGKRGARFVLWICGAVVAVIAAYNAMLGGKP